MGGGFDTESILQDIRSAYAGRRVDPDLTRAGAPFVAPGDRRSVADVGSAYLALGHLLTAPYSETAPDLRELLN